MDREEYHPAHEHHQERVLDPLDRRDLVQEMEMPEMTGVYLGSEQGRQEQQEKNHQGWVKEREGHQSVTPHLATQPAAEHRRG